MQIKKYCITLIVLLFYVGFTYAQERRTEICVDFRVNSTMVDSAYSDNAVRMLEIIDFLRNIRQDSTINIVEVSFCGAASPEGSDQLNRKLAQGRMATLEKIIRQEVEIPDSLITRNDNHIPWHYLISMVKDSELSHKDELLEILTDESTNRITKIQQLDGGRIWQQIKRQYFARMRNACAVIVTYRKELVPVQIPEILPEPVVEPVEEPVIDTIQVQPVLPEPEKWIRRLHVKTNALALAAAISNVTTEVDLARHWSFALPVYYSAWDYFKSTIKFRTLGIQPELRYWINPENRGWFAGAHASVAYFNLAVDGDFRFQDHDQRTPALGGGVTLGYRTHLSSNKRWNIEFAIGAGCYYVHYNKYYNVDNGRLVNTRCKTYIGPDNAAINLSYSFDLNKRKK